SSPKSGSFYRAQRHSLLSLGDGRESRPQSGVPLFTGVSEGLKQAEVTSRSQRPEEAQKPRVLTCGTPTCLSSGNEKAPAVSAPFQSGGFAAFRAASSRRI